MTKSDFEARVARVKRRAKELGCEEWEVGRMEDPFYVANRHLSRQERLEKWRLSKLNGWRRFYWRALKLVPR